MHGQPDPAADPAAHELTLFAAGMLARLDDCMRRIESAYEGHRFSEVAQALYDFVWGDFCDRFLEAAKADLAAGDSPRKTGTLAAMDHAISCILRLLHPFVPFVTEELWQGMGFGNGGSIQQAVWPSPGGFQPDARNEAISDWVAAARNARSTYNLPSNKKLAWAVSGIEPWMERELPVLATLLNASSLEVTEGSPGGLSATVPSALGTLYLPLEGLVDVQAEISRLGGELKKVEAEILKVRNKLASENFVRNAPADVVEEHRERERGWNERAAALQAALNGLKNNSPG